MRPPWEGVSIPVPGLYSYLEEGDLETDCVVVRDVAQVTDQVIAELVPWAPPRWPCPACGRESKADHAFGSRVCSDRACRQRFPS